MQNLTRAVMILATAVLAGGVGAGCGGDDDDSSGGDFTTGIAPNKLLSDVTAEEATTACENLTARVETTLNPDKIARAICTLVGAATADTKDACEAIRDDCLDDPMAGQAAGEVEGPECDGESDLAQCTGTVAQLESCVNDTLDQFEAFLSQFSCDDAATIDESAFEEMDSLGFEEPASCADVGCPEDSVFGP